MSQAMGRVLFFFLPRGAGRLFYYSILVCGDEEPTTPPVLSFERRTELHSSEICVSACHRLLVSAL